MHLVLGSSMHDRFIVLSSEMIYHNCYSSGMSAHHPIPPALEMLAVQGLFHVTNKRDGLLHLPFLLFSAHSLFERATTTSEIGKECGI